MSAIDRVLSAIDSGLQSSSETGYATDRAEMCARCQRVAPAEHGEFCGGCRAYLLGDGPEPIDVAMAPRHVQTVETVLASMSPEEIAAAWEATTAAFRRLQEAMAGAIADVAEVVAEKMAPLLNLFAQPEQPAGELLAAKSCRPLPQSPLQLGPLRSAVLPAPRMHRVQHRR